MAFAFNPTSSQAHASQSHASQARTAATLARLDRLSRILDIAFAIPGTKIRFGAEAIIRLVPGIGDLIATGLSTFIIIEAHKLGVPKHILLRMIANVALEGAAGAVPIAGDAFDVMFRSNRRNLALLRGHLASTGIF